MAKAKIKEGIKEAAEIFVPSILIVLAILCFVQLGNWFIPHKEVHDGVTYQMNRGEAEALWVTPLNFNKEVVIPLYVNGRTVKINKEQFKTNMWTEKVILSDGLK